MKIWVINHYAYAPDQSAGTRHYAFAKALQDRGHDVLVIASSFYHKGRKEARLVPGERYRRQMIGGVTFQWLRTPEYQNNPVKRLWNMVVFAARICRARWRQQDERPDVILGSSPSLPAAAAAWVLAHRMGIPFVMEIRDIWPDSLRDIGNLSRLNPVYLVFKWLERFLYRRADAIVTVLPKSHDHIVANGGKSEDIVWIPNGVALADNPVLSPASSEEPFVLMYFGVHGPYAGLETLIEAVSLLCERGLTKNTLSIVLIGEGPVKPALLDMTHSRNLDAFIEFRDPVPRSELWASIQEAKAFLFITRALAAYEKGMSPNKLWDYLAAGRPIVFSTTGGDSLAANSAAGIFVQPEDASALADGIERLIGLSEQERTQMGRNGRAYAERTADLPVLAMRLEQVLTSVVSANSESSR